MSPQETEYGLEERVADVQEYTGHARHRHRESAKHVSSRGLRWAFFSASSAWGFIVGVGGMLVTLQLQGQVIRTGLDSLLFLLPALAIAVGGAFIVAGAYQEAKRRRR